MRTVFVVQNWLAHYRVPLFNAVRDRGHRLTVVCGRSPERLGFGDPSDRAKFEVVSVSGQKRIAGALLSRLRPGDLAVSMFQAKRIDLAAASFAARRRNAGWLWWGHSRNYAGHPLARAVGRWLRRFLALRSEGIIAYSAGDAADWSGLGISSERVFVAVNTVEVGDVVESCRAQGPGGPGPLTVGFIGRLYPGKRADVAVEVVRRARERGGDLRLIVIGDGPELRRLKSEHAACPWISWAGRVEDGPTLGRLLAGIRVMLNPGIVGLNLIQPFACGIPVIAFESPSHSPEIDYLRDGETGLRVRGGAAEMAEALDRLVRDPELHARLSRGARQFWEERLQMKSMVEGFCRALERS